MFCAQPQTDAITRAEGGHNRLQPPGLISSTTNSSYIKTVHLITNQPNSRGQKTLDDVITKVTFIELHAPMAAVAIKSLYWALSKLYAGVSLRDRQTAGLLLRSFAKR